MTNKNDKNNKNEKNKKENNKKKKFEPPQIEDVKKYFSENGYTESSAIKFFSFYSSGDWHDGNGKPVLRWKQKAQGVWFKDENKIKQNPGSIYQKTAEEILSHVDKDPTAL